MIQIYVHLSGTVDEILALNGAAISLHCRDLTLFYKNLLDSGSLQDLDTWIG